MSISFINRKSGMDIEEILEQLDAQDTIIENLKTTLNEKAVNPGGTPNIFLQDEEPSKKQGIWLKTTGKEYEKVVAEDSVVAEPTWLPDGTARNIPYSFNQGSATAVGTDVYLFGGIGDGYGLADAYKYDTLTNTYTKLTNIPYQFFRGCSVSVGTDIYILGGQSSKKNNYKYDTLTNTYTKMTDIPYNVNWQTAVSMGTDIYILGGYNGNNRINYNYKYDTLTNTYTKMTDIPYTYYWSDTAVTIGTDIYILGGYSSNNYKYDTLTDTWTKKTNIPESSYHYKASACSIGTDIYLFGGENTPKTVYKYSTLTDTYTKMTDIPYNFYSGDVGMIDNKIYLFGGEAYSTKVQVLQFPSSEFEDKSIVLLNGNTYETQLFTSELVDTSVKYSFSDVWLYEDSEGLETDIPTYYGDGTQWVNIKNPINNGGGE